MRYLDEDEVKRVNAEQWQLDLLELNPSYCSWGPHEDYMWTKDSQGWNSSQVSATWADFGPWTLDELNECVNFYFSVNRESKQCETCGGDGYHPDAHTVSNTFYRHMNDQGEHWNDKITQDELDALKESGRVKSDATVESVNAENHPGARGMGHDAINRHILIQARLKRLGLPETCPACEGHGYVYTAPAAHVSLTLWWLHPRKGCSRGIEITSIQQSELPVIFAFLRSAADRNANRFSKIPSSPPAHPGEANG